MVSFAIDTRHHPFYSSDSVAQVPIGLHNQPEPIPVQSPPRARAVFLRFRKDLIPELDGLRGIAVCLVLWVHLPKGCFGTWIQDLRGLVAPGYLGVDMFFVLSGFLITRILLVDRESGVPLRYFLIRRFLRIFPIYYLLLFVIQIVSPRPAAEFYACAFYYANYAFPFIEGYSRLEHFWSLAVEEHFYLLWPPLAHFLSPRLSRRLLGAFFIPLSLLTGFVVLFVLEWRSPEIPRELTMHGSTSRFGSLALGALFAYHESLIRRHPRRVLFVVAAVSILALCLSDTGLFGFGGYRDIAIRCGLDQEPRRVLYAMRLVSFPLVSASLLLLSISFTKTRAPHAVLLRARWLRGIGRISYGLYLYHFPLYRFAGLHQSEPFSPRIAFALILTFAVATGSYFVIEAPILRYARRFRAGPSSADRIARETGGD